MNVRIRSLALQCSQAREVIEFSPQVSFFHGQISAGKSSIARLVDFCLGGSLEETPALTQELVSAELTASIGEHEVVLQRELGSNQVQVMWRNREGETGRALAPLRAGPTSRPIWGEKVRNLSDLIFSLSGIEPMKVRRSKTDPDSPLIRLSFRDVMRYCYLDQAHLDSSFYRLEDPIRGPKSRDVMRFVVGYYTKALNRLEIELESVHQERASKVEAVRQIRSFLEQVGFGAEEEMQAGLDNARAEMGRAKAELEQVRSVRRTDTHFVDEVRRQARDAAERLGKEENALRDIEEKVNELNSLRAELVSSQFKLARSDTASSILSGASFERCPACGVNIRGREYEDEGACALCGRKAGQAGEISAPRTDVVRRDLQSRIGELDEAIGRHNRALARQQRTLSDAAAQKAALDRRLQEELADYDSAYVARSREAERRVATLEERIRLLEERARIAGTISELEAETDRLTGEENRLRREIEAEKGKLTNAGKFIEDIESAWLDALLAVRVPGVTAEDRVVLNLKTWAPSILSGGDEALQWGFQNAGSGGKKTLLNVCYALAVHKVASQNGLPLPCFLIIDTPMKNIGEDVNEGLFRGFYGYLYGLAQTELVDTQFIIIDKEFVPPEGEGIRLVERYMTPDDEEHPPLVPYYRGP